MMRRNYFNAARSPELAAEMIEVGESQQQYAQGSVVSAGVPPAFLPAWASSYGSVYLYVAPVAGLLLLFILFKCVKWFIARRRAAAVVVADGQQPRPAGGAKHVHFEEKVDIKRVDRLAAGRGVVVQEEHAKLKVDITSNGGGGFFCGIKNLCHACFVYVKAWSCAVMHKVMCLIHLLLAPWKMGMRLVRRLVSGQVAVQHFGDEASNVILQAKLKLASQEIDSLFNAERGNAQEIMNKVTAESSGWMLPMIQQAHAAGQVDHAADLQRAYAYLNGSGGAVTY